MATFGVNQPQPTMLSAIKIKKISLNAPLRWLMAGFNDFKISPINSLSYGLVFAVLGILIFLLLKNYPTFIITAVSGFLLVGPFIAIGLYDMSQQIENSKRPTVLHALKQLQFNTMSIISFAFIVAFIFAFWSRFTGVLTAVVFDNFDLAANGWANIFTNDSTPMILLTFMLAGLGLAAFVFSISVVAVPMMTHKKVDVITAMVTSLRAVKENFIPMLLWAVLIVAMIAIGFITFYIGLIITLPIVGHASWHAYRELVED
jgi:uncharacterized membrane protein